MITSFLFPSWSVPWSSPFVCSQSMWHSRRCLWLVCMHWHILITQFGLFFQNSFCFLQWKVTELIQIFVLFSLLKFSRTIRQKKKEKKKPHMSQKVVENNSVNSFACLLFLPPTPQTHHLIYIDICQFCIIAFLKLWKDIQIWRNNMTEH